MEPGVRLPKDTGVPKYAPSRVDALVSVNMDKDRLK
jgi:hypothetical protein